MGKNRKFDFFTYEFQVGLGILSINLRSSKVEKVEIDCFLHKNIANSRSLESNGKNQVVVIVLKLHLQYGVPSTADFLVSD